MLPINPGLVASVADLDDLRAQLREALEQQTAMSEVLRVISAATSDLLVFDAVVVKASDLCEAEWSAAFP